MWTRLNSLQFSKKTIPWAFVLVTILAYGLLAPWLGFYWDDWVFVWLLEHHGPVELARSFLPYDPLVSPFFLFSSSILGTHPFAWQVFGLAVRALVGLAALWTFNQIWPRYSRKALWAGLLFLVYPGYGQQWVAFTHANQEWISFGFFVLSLGLTARSLHDPRKKMDRVCPAGPVRGAGNHRIFPGNGIPAAGDDLVHAGRACHQQAFYGNS